MEGARGVPRRGENKASIRLIASRGSEWVGETRGSLHSSIFLSVHLNFDTFHDLI